MLPSPRREEARGDASDQTEPQRRDHGSLLLHTRSVKSPVISISQLKSFEKADSDPGSFQKLRTKTNILIS